MLNYVTMHMPFDSKTGLVPKIERLKSKIVDDASIAHIQYEERMKAVREHGVALAKMKDTTRCWQTNSLSALEELRGEVVKHIDLSGEYKPTCIDIMETLTFALSKLNNVSRGKSTKLRHARDRCTKPLL